MVSIIKKIVFFALITSTLFAQPFKIIPSVAGYIQQYPTLVSDDTIKFNDGVAFNNYTTANIQWSNDDKYQDYYIIIENAIDYSPFVFTNSYGYLPKNTDITMALALNPIEDTTYNVPIRFYSVDFNYNQIDTFNLVIHAVVSGLGDSTPVIIEQPIATTITEGEDGFIFVDAVASDVGYQWWYQRVPNGTSYEVPDNSVFDGVTNDTLFINNAPDSIDGYIFTCEVKNLDCYPTYPCWTNSDEVVLTVEPDDTPSAYEYGYIVDTRIGVGDFYTIAQLNAASIPSGSVVGFQGGQVFSDATLQCKAGVTYTTYGSGIATIGSASSSVNPQINIDYSGAVIDSLKIITSNVTGTSSNYHNAVRFSKGFTIKNCEIIGGNAAHNNSYSHAIINSATTTENVIITNNKIHGITCGIYIYHPYNVDISYNEIYDCYKYYGSANNGGWCIELQGDDWDANYTVNINHNDLYNFEHSAIGHSVSKLIIEYNEIHHNLDQRLYFGGVKHGTAGKLYDNTNDELGQIGTIFRYNVVHDLTKTGSIDSIYYRPTPAQLEAGEIQSASISGYNRPIFDNADANGNDWGDEGWESSDAVISGLGYCNMAVHNNIFYNIDHCVFNRGYNYLYASSSNGLQTFNSTYSTYVYNNTIYNVARKSWATEYHGAFDITAEAQSPTNIKNNIVYVNHDGIGDSYDNAIQYAEAEGSIDYNIFTNRSGGSSTYSSGLAVWFRYNANISYGYYNKNNTNANFNNTSGTYTLSNVGISGVTIPDLRTLSGNAYNTGVSLGSDPTGRSYNYSINGALRSTNNIGAL